ncbi:hypothetical protein POF50_016655 [Streptomyces sp. SL13]|uniref:Uncharacterized protein n=1 Tax=Streptantibioticus silvisoli TaxID=2705255 RepID=A0AA90GZ46_9ACTN|nr:hypothetical protein [Streptantibioticus silvisoli]MDI5970953.1 hypothetical protein [Streptantibioticus silvisoli]
MNSQEEQPTWRLHKPKSAPAPDTETLRLGDVPATSQSWTAVPLVADDTPEPANSSPDVVTVDVTPAPTRSLDGVGADGSTRSPAGAGADVPTRSFADPGADVPTRWLGEAGGDVPTRSLTRPGADVSTRAEPEPRRDVLMTVREEVTGPVRTAPSPTVPIGGTRPESGRTRPESAGAPPTVIRFGPGVPAPETAAIAAVWHGASPPVPRRRRRTGYLTGALVVLAVIALLLWQRQGPALALRSVAVSAPSGTLACGGTEEVVGTVRTNGRAGTLRYRWHRSDGTDTGPTTQHVAAGPTTLRLPLRWTFVGHGTFHATASLDVISPDPRTASVSFTYDCR